MSKYLKSLTMYFPSSGAHKLSDLTANKAENHYKSDACCSYAGEHNGTLNPEHHRNTRQRSVREVGEKFRNVLPLHPLLHWWRSGWEEGRWP
jgi:hypothetical protein